jgi:hypothetical protein
LYCKVYEKGAYFDEMGFPLLLLCEENGEGIYEMMKLLLFFHVLASEGDRIYPQGIKVQWRASDKKVG